ncbi:hypothetical protein C8Q72DRAFT_787740, partial [Fomitopsis betulina]
DNKKFNNHVSIIRVRSEHAIGFLKGQFQSLKHLRVNIQDERSHKITTYWIKVCMPLPCNARQRNELRDQILVM